MSYFLSVMDKLSDFFSSPGDPFAPLDAKMHRANASKHFESEKISDLTRRVKPQRSKFEALETEKRSSEYHPTTLGTNHEVEAEKPVRKACGHCSRWFAEDRLEKHMAVCVKASKKRKRKAFNVQEKRMEDEAKEAARKETLEGY